MGINVVDDAKLQQALTGVTDAAVKGLATQVLPVVGALVDAAITRLQASLGDALADVTVERQELVNDVHGILDRLNGTTVRVAEVEYFRLVIPARLPTGI